MQTTDHEPLAAFFKALAHPERLSILALLSDGEYCVCEMAARLGQRQAYISQQLAVLRQAGLVTCRRAGWQIVYRLTDRRILGLVADAQAIAGPVQEAGSLTARCAESANPPEEQEERRDVKCQSARLRVRQLQTA